LTRTKEQMIEDPNDAGRGIMHVKGALHEQS